VALGGRGRLALKHLVTVETLLETGNWKLETGNWKLENEREPRVYWSLQKSRADSISSQHGTQLLRLAVLQHGKRLRAQSLRDLEMA
jgi:hypothetical protein